MVSTAPTVARIFSSNAIILEPTRSDGTDVLFFFLPGAFAAAEAYLPLLKEVQSKCCVRLWVAILDPAPVPFVITARIEASFPRVLERVQQMGFPVGSYTSEGVVFGGHSFGAVQSRSVALIEAEAFIQLGSCFDFTRDNLVQYPKPVLTLSGALDGQVTNAAIAKHAGEVFDRKDELGDFFVYGVKPVILVPGMNHAQFSHGIPDIDRGDFEAEISIEEARDVSSTLISSFITLHMCKSAAGKEAVSASLTVLKEAVSQTHEQYKALWEGMAEPGRNARKMQVALASLPTVTESNIGVVQHDFEDNFIYSKPSMDLMGRRIIINTFLSPVGKFNLLSDLLLKCKSGEAVAAAFHDGDGTVAQQEPSHSTGADFNKRTFAEALEKVPEAVRKKYEERGKKLRFVEDLVMMQSPDWVDSELILKPADDGTGYVDVQSPVLISPVAGGVPERFAGMHYFKLLTAGRALSWVYEDCFRKQKTEDDRGESSVSRYLH